MIVWNLPASGPHLGVSVRVGARGPVVPQERGAVLLAGAPLPGTTMQVRYALTDAPLTLRVSTRDLARVAPRGGRVRLCATVYHGQGASTHTLAVTVEDSAPDGLIFALVTRDGTYLSAEGLPDTPMRLHVTCQDGTSYEADNPGSGVTFVEGQASPPTRVTARDEEGRESGDLLAGVEIEPDGGPDSTDLSAWPLPPYLRPERPNLAAFLRAFEAALDVRPEQAGRYLNPATSSGAPLTRLGELFGVSRVDAPTDAQVARRVLAAPTPNKASRAGLGAMLRAHGIFGAHIEDAMSLTLGRLLALDGTWTLNGGYALDGGMNGWNLEAGEVLAVFRRAPLAGLGQALQVLRRYKAAGIHARVMLRQSGFGELPQPGTRAALTRRATLPALHAHRTYRDLRLFLDGSWPLDGSENLDGLKET